MATKTEHSIRLTIDSSMCSMAVYDEYINRLSLGKTTRDENNIDHFCVYFLPFNPSTQEVFIVHHKKARQWIAAGGHIDKNETPLETFVRETREELGAHLNPPADYRPFLLTISPIDNPVHLCKTHYDFWYGIETDGSNFNIDSTEFNETRWVTLAEARKLVTDPPNLAALDKIEQTVFHKPR